MGWAPADAGARNPLNYLHIVRTHAIIAIINNLFLCLFLPLLRPCCLVCGRLVSLVLALPPRLLCLHCLPFSLLFLVSVAVCLWGARLVLIQSCVSFSLVPPHCWFSLPSRPALLGVVRWVLWRGGLLRVCIPLPPVAAACWWCFHLASVHLLCVLAVHFAATVLGLGVLRPWRLGWLGAWWCGLRLVWFPRCGLVSNGLTVAAVGGCYHQEPLLSCRFFSSVGRLPLFYRCSAFVASIFSAIANKQKFR